MRLPFESKSQTYSPVKSDISQKYLGLKWPSKTHIICGLNRKNVFQSTFFLNNNLKSILCRNGLKHALYFITVIR